MLSSPFGHNTETGCLCLDLSTVACIPLAALMSLYYHRRLGQDFAVEAIFATMIKHRTDL